MAFVIRIEASMSAADPLEGGSLPAYLKSFDPDVQGPDKPYPTGDLTVTLNPAHARRFETKGECFALWKLQSTVCPLRPDGRPNRPLSAYTISIEPAP